MRTKYSIGDKVGNLLILSRASKVGNSIRWNVKCDCGTDKIITTSNLKRDAGLCRCRGSYSWGHPEKNGIGSFEYRAWTNIRKRVTSGTAKMCERWLNSYDDFLNDIGRSPGNEFTVDRIDNSKGYSPDNCRWADAKQQGRNRSNNLIIEYNGKSQCLSAWAEEFKINAHTLWVRIYTLGWDLEKSLTTSVNTRNKGRPKGPPSKRVLFPSEYISWKSMKSRCLDSKHVSYKYYGGIGVQVEESWIISFEKFLEDLGPKSNPDLTLDRINVNLGYFKENCRWADKIIQANNKK